MKTLALFVIPLALSGCNLFQQKVGPQVATAIKQYCLEPYEARLLLRTEVNGLIVPNTARVDCAGDANAGSPTNK